MVKDYLFIYSNLFDNVLNVLRWVGVVLLFVFCKKEEDRFIKTMYIIMFIFFLNPLCTVLLSKTITGIVYYRAFEIIFNPFTEIVLFYAVYKVFEWQVLGQLVVEFVLIIATGIGQIGSYYGMNEGLYGFYINGANEIGDMDPLAKIDKDEVTASLFLQDYVEQNPQTDRVTLISQSGAIRTYLPQAYQVFTPREHFYTQWRIDENFYQITKRHYPWLDPEPTDYSKTCASLAEYGVDYILLQYWENPEFDEASDACSITVYTGSKYKVKVVNN